MSRVWFLQELWSRLRPRRGGKGVEWWQNSAQKYELGFHKTWLAEEGGGTMSEADWKHQNHCLFVALSGESPYFEQLQELGSFREYWAHTGHDREAEFNEIWGRVEGKRVLDVGCGSRVRSVVFERSRVNCIEPLAGEYQKVNHGYYDRENIEKVHALPAEDRVDDLVDSCDLVFCWNVLDHCYDWKRVLGNVSDYLTADGVLILGSDLDEDNVGHRPIEGGGPALIRCCRASGLQLQREIPGELFARGFIAVFRKSSA